MPSAKLDYLDKTIEIPVFEGSEKEIGLDIGKLRSQTGLVTLDNGFVNTGSCTSAITFLDGEKGILRYRGYNIEELAEKSNFEEVSYLLLNGSLPTADQLKSFKNKISKVAELPSGIKALIESFPKDAHPMAVTSAAFTALGSYYKDFEKEDLDETEKADAFAVSMGAIKLIASTYYRNSIGKKVKSVDSSRSYAEDFAALMYDELDPDVAKALDTLFILHADHEQNCSASTVRIVGSSKANLFASLSAGINALWGPLHGGANQAVIEMLDAIQADGGDYQKYLDKAKDKSDSFRLMGFGHRVYKNFDPRARIIKKSCDIILQKLGVNDPILAIAKGLEDQALKDPYFVERKLYPNVDFYSGIIYRALGIPTNMFTVMFAIGRLPGWMAQWKEMIEASDMRIYRPRQIYTGENSRSYK
jgi:citrate synthase